MAIFNISMGSSEADSPSGESRDACRPEDAWKRAAERAVNRMENPFETLLNSRMETT